MSTAVAEQGNSCSLSLIKLFHDLTLSFVVTMAGHGFTFGLTSNTGYITAVSVQDQRLEHVQPVSVKTAAFTKPKLLLCCCNV